MKQTITKRYIKKITAFLLALLVAIGIVPPNVVLANPQNPVTVPPGSIQNLTDSESPLQGPYDFRLTWVWSPGDADQTTTPGLTNPGVHQPVGFDIEWRNASVGETFLTSGGVRRTPGNSNTARNYEFSGPLRSGSIYSFRVVPWHMHYFPASPTPPFTIPPPQRIVPPAAQMREVLYLTDIEVDLEPGAMGGMLITWDNPRFDGQDVFSGYQIEFRAGGGAWQSAPSVTSTTPGVEVIGGGARWRFELVDGRLAPGVAYDVRITPLIGGSQFGVPGGPTTVEIGQNLFSIAASTRRYIGTGFYLRPRLSLHPEGLQYLFLNWSMPDLTTHRVTRIRIWSTVESIFNPETQQYEPPEDFPNPARDNLVHTINNQLGINSTHHLVMRPTEVPTWYVVEIHGYTIAQGPDFPFTMLTNVAGFDPLFDAFAAYSPTIREIVDNHEYVRAAASTELEMNVTWLAFTRSWFRPMDDHLFVIREDAQGNPQEVIDNQLMFYVYVTDSLDNLGVGTANGPRISHLERIDGRTLMAEELEAESMTGIPGAYRWFYNYTFTEYINHLGQRRPLQGNTIYYVRIVAVRYTWDGPFYSQPGYGSHYIPPIADLDLRPLMVPVRIKEVDGLRQIGADYMYIQWNQEWFEVYNQATDRWYDVVGLAPASATTPGGLVFGRAADNLDPNQRVRLWDRFNPAHSLGDVRSVLVSLLGAGPELVVRRVRVVPSYYEIHVVEYDIMADTPAIGGITDPYEMYMRGINTQDGGAWQNIGAGTQTEGNANFREHRVTISNNEPGSLQPNTSYVVFFRPVNEIQNVRYPAHYPTYTTGTTITDRPPLDIDPTVPRLEVVTEETTDTSITLRWNGSFVFDYDLFFSELLTDYPSYPHGESGGYQIPMELILQEGREEGGFIYFTVQGLFPYTLYHFWIRAINEQGRTSVWSNPVSERTLDIIPPEPPTSIRPATSTTLQAINAETASEYDHSDPNQLILEWQRIWADLNNPLRGPRQVGYDVNAGESGLTATWLDRPSRLTAEVPNQYPGMFPTYVALFDELLPLRQYYVRVQTILTVTRGDSPGSIIRAYSYRMQLADNIEFLDAIEIIIPALNPAYGVNNIPGQMRRAVSDWSDNFFFRTDADPYEYERPAHLYPLPERDWEIIYDRPSSTLTFRFRTNQIDATGMRDQNVDQRFISRLIQQRVFTYRLDMSTYNNQPVANAVVEVPYSILRAFHERQISLEVTMDNLRVNFTPGSLATTEALSLAGVGPDTTARLMINSGLVSAPYLAEGGSYASVPRVLEAELVTPQRTLRFDTFAEPVELAFALDGQALLMEQNVALYTATDWTQGWERLAANHSPVTGELVFNTRQSGNFAAIAQAAPVQIMPIHPSRDAFLRVNARIAITDMATFDPNEPVTGTVFNNLVAAIALNRPSVEIYGAIDPTDAQSLTRAQMFVPAQIVSREAGISALVTLYERRIGRAVQPASMAPADISAASADNQLALLKAENLGFISGGFRPGEVLTMGDLMTILDIIILDMG